MKTITPLLPLTIRWTPTLEQGQSVYAITSGTVVYRHTGAAVGTSTLCSMMAVANSGSSPTHQTRDST